MSSLPGETPHDLKDFEGFFRDLQEEGFDFAVIGGCAVSAYAHLLEEPLTTVDLDILVTPSTLEEILAWAPTRGIRIVKRPQPRNIPVAFLDFRGLEVNVLTWSTGLPDAHRVTRFARSFGLRDGGDLEIPIADPHDLLANKLAVAREKDRPHIEILQRYIEAEIVAIFASNTHARARMEPARRYLEVRGAATLPIGLSERLIDLAREGVDFRFLANRVPTRELAKRLLDQLPDEPTWREQVETILARRSFDGA